MDKDMKGRGAYRMEKWEAKAQELGREQGSGPVTAESGDCSRDVGPLLLGACTRVDLWLEQRDARGGPGPPTVRRGTTAWV